jgi:putative acetyltransferase
MHITVAPERPDTLEVLAILTASDTFAASIYPAESNHMMDPTALLEPDVFFLVARVDGVAAATGAVVCYAGYGEIKRMFVLPHYRGLGLGRRVLQALLDHLRRQGVSLARLETGIYNVEALGLYERAGFQKVGPFGDYAEDSFSVFYELRLT